jgi:ADP-heptose:LPS heptosyltransferase
MRVLALVPGGIGDQILFFPTLDELKRAYPNAQIDIVVEPRAKEAYRVCKSIHDIIPFDFKQNNSLADWGNLLGIIRDREYDIALSLGRSWAVGLLLWLTGVPTRVGYAGGRGESFLTNAVPLKTEQYAAAMYHDLLQGLGVSSPCQPITINVPKKDIEWAEAEQKRLGLPASGYVLIHGGASKLSQAKGINKIYPVENWKKIIQDFRKRQPELPIVVAQGPDDVAFVSALQQACPDVKVTAPSDLGKLAAMIAGASLMLCTDSAPMHLAVAVQTFTLALFGPTDPAKLLPASTDAKETRFVSIKSPGNIADITPETVLKKVWGG